VGLFARKINQIQTEEERYQEAAKARAVEEDRQARYEAVNREASEQYRARREVKAEKRKRIKKVGEIRKVGPGKYVTTGWEIDAPDGSGRGRVTEDRAHHRGDLGGFTPAELCAIAHGPHCRRCR
jgi:hypothetical protein